MIDIVQQAEFTTPRETVEFIEACTVFGFEFVLTATWQPDTDTLDDTKQHMVYTFVVTDPDKTQVISVDRIEEMLRNASVPVGELDLHERTRLCLYRADILTVGQLAACSVDDLLNIPNMGMKSVDDVRNQLAELGMNLSGDL